MVDFSHVVGYSPEDIHASTWSSPLPDPTPERILPMDTTDESTKPQTDDIMNMMDYMLNIAQTVADDIPEDYAQNNIPPPSTSHHLWHSMESGVESATHSVTSSLSSAWDSTEDFFSGALGSTEDFVSDTAHSAEHFFNGMPNFVETEFSKTVDFLTPTKLIDDVKDVGREAGHIAKDAAEVLLVGLGLGAALLYYNRDTIVEYGGKAYNEAKKAAPLFLV